MRRSAGRPRPRERRALPHLVTPGETWCGRHGHFTRRFPPPREIAREYRRMPVNGDDTFQWNNALDRLWAIMPRAVLLPKT
jgi:hypothetical protein